MEILSARFIPSVVLGGEEVGMAESSVVLGEVGGEEVGVAVTVESVGGTVVPSTGVKFKETHESVAKLTDGKNWTV